MKRRIEQSKVFTRVLAGAWVFVASMPATIAQVSLPDLVETQSLKADAFSTGILNQRDGALPANLWNGSDAATLDFLLDYAPERPAFPAVGKALRRTLLSPSEVTSDLANQPDRQALGGKKLLALVKAGFTEDARTIASLSDAERNDAFTGKAMALADLLAKDDNAACSRGASLSAERGDPFWVKLRAFCYSISDERDAADLTLSLLRDQGLLGVHDEKFLTAIVTGVRPAKPLSPQTALELAISRNLEMPIGAGVLNTANGSVVRSMADDIDLDIDIRILAARQALAMGLMDASDYKQLLSSAPLELEVVGNPYDALINNPTAPVTDAIVWQAVQALSAPEFLRDKAALIAKAHASGEGFNHLNALSHLYAADVASLEGALIPADEAASFALARLIVGDGQGAGRWLLGMQGDSDITELGDKLARDYIGLVNLLHVLDPATAAIVADRAGIDISEPSSATFNTHSSATQADPTLPAKITEIVFDAAMGNADGDKKIGQAALASLALSNATQAGANAVQSVVMERALVIAGMNDLRRQLAFQAAWKASLPPKSATVIRKPKTSRDDTITPSLRPNRRNR